MCRREVFSRTGRKCILLSERPYVSAFGAGGTDRWNMILVIFGTVFSTD